MYTLFAKLNLLTWGQKRTYNIFDDIFNVLSAKIIVLQMQAYEK